MKVNQIIKAVATVTTLGVFLAGCSGGDPAATTTRTTTSTPGTTNQTTLPTAGGSPTVGGGGSIGVGGNAMLDDIRATQLAQDQKFDQILQEARTSSHYAQSAANKSDWAMWIGAAALALLAAERINTGIQNSETKEGGFWSGLTLNNKNPQTRTIAKDAADGAVAGFDTRLEKTDKKVEATTAMVKKGNESNDKQFGQIGKDMGTVKMALGFNIIATLAAANAAAANGAKTEQIAKGQDSLVAKARVAEVALANIKTFQDSSATSLAAMTKQLATAEQAAGETKTSLDTLIASTSNEAQKKILNDYIAAMDKSMEESRKMVKDAYAEGVKNAPNKEEYAKAVVIALGQKPTELSDEGIAAALSDPRVRAALQKSIKERQSQAGGTSMEFVPPISRAGNNP